MVKQRWKKKGKAAPDVQADADPTTRAIALCNDMVAVAAGWRWRVIDTRSGAVLHDNTSHDAPVRSLAFSPDGQYLVTCGDDKTARVWRTSDWQCLQKLKSGKKSTACTFSADGKHVFFSDRFGDVLCATTLPASAPPAAAGTEAAPAADNDSSASKDGPSAAAEASDAVEANLLLGHLQSIVSSLGCCSSSTGQPLIISTDKDGKVRASILPADPTKGSYEIQSYCLGHTKFVTCSAVVPQQAAAASSSQHLVLSGSGDGTVRLWDVDSGKQLGCYTASEQPPSLAFQQQQEEEAGGASAGEEQQQDPQDGQEQGNEGGSGSGSDDERQEQANGTAAAADGDGKQQAAAAAAADESCKVHHKAAGKYQRLREACCAVLSVAVSPDSCTLAVAVEGQQELLLVSLDTATGQMQLLQKLSFADVANPAAAAFDSKGQLWVVGGVLVRDTASAHVGVAARNTDGGQWEPVTAAVLQDDLRAALELRVQDEEEKQQQQQQQEGYYFEGFKRAVYMVEEGVERPKRPRRDLRDIQRLRALAAAKDQEEEQQKQAAEAAQG